MENIYTKGTEIRFDESRLSFTITHEGDSWNWGEGFRPRMECEEGTIYFADAKKDFTIEGVEDRNRTWNLKPF